MEELNRFFKSIDFAWCDDFKDSKIVKVVYNRDTLIYNVHLSSENVINYDIINNLFNCAKKGINKEQKCLITLEYLNVLDKDIEEYLKRILNDIVFEHPSLMGLENSFKEVKDNIIYLEGNTQTLVNALEDYKQDIINKWFR